MSERVFLVQIAMLGGLVGALVWFVVGVVRGGGRGVWLGMVWGSVAAMMGVAALVLRARESARVPFQAISEVCLLVALVPQITFGVAYGLVRLGRLGGGGGRRLAVLGCVASSTSLVGLLGAFAAGGRQLLLPPALRSAWFVPHVLAYTIAYGLLGMAGLGGVVRTVVGVAHWGGGSGAAANRASLLASLDRLILALVMVGFPFLTMGLVFGCFWAQLAWGAWWGWDPKETWALVAWFVYLLYLHLHSAEGDRGTVGRGWMVVLGAAALFVCLFLVDYLPGASLHRYG